MGLQKLGTEEQTLVCPGRLRMLEKETQHFPRCIRTLSVRIGSRRAASGPGVAGAVDIPVLQHLSFAVRVSRAGIPMPSRNLPAMHLLSRPSRSEGIFDSVGAVARMHGGVAVAMKNNGRDHVAARHMLTTALPPLSHGGERRRYIGGGAVGEAGMDPDRRV